jgi:hypothetical protein
MKRRFRLATSGPTPATYRHNGGRRGHRWIFGSATMEAWLNARIEAV